MLQKKEYQQHLQKLMLQKKDTAATKLPVAPTKTNVTKEGVTTATKLPVAPTKTNVTKEGYQQQQSYQ